MARVAGIVVAASAGMFGPRAQRYAVETGGPAVSHGQGDILGSIFSFIPQTVAAIGQNLPAAEAASGLSSAQQYEAQQGQEATTLAQTQTAPYTAQVAEAQAQATEVGYAAAGFAAFGLAMAVGLAASASRGRD